MKLTWLGHASFILETAAGTRIVTDPYSQDILRHTAPKADIVTISHEHHDHNDLSTLPQYGEVLRGAKEWESSDIFIHGHACWHDNENGKKRGPNTVFIFEADGLKIAHLGDLGEPLTPELREALTGLDALLLPVGGVYTIDGEQASAVVRELKPRYAVPMHYSLPGHSMQVLDDGSLFLRSLDRDISVSHAASLSFTEPEGVIVLENQ